jgi:prevent-host-death family protein
MTVTTLSDFEFDQDTGRARRAASDGPVFITDRGEPAHVLLNIEDYRRLTRQGRTIADLLAMRGSEDVDLDVPPRTERASPVDLA